MISCKDDKVPEVAKIVETKTSEFTQEKIKTKNSELINVLSTENFISICDRSSFFQERLLNVLDISKCDEVTAENVAEIKSLNLRGSFLNGNRLTGLNKNDFQGFVNLKSLDLSANELYGQDDLEEGVFDNLTSLEELKLTNNSISFLQNKLLIKLKNLKSLDLGHNYIEELPPLFLRTNSALENLDLSSNKILNFDSSALSVPSKLKTLNLSANYISVIDDSTFIYATSLVGLNLSDNSIKKITDSAFSQSKKTLRKINLSMNNLRELEFGVFFEMPALEILDLSGASKSNYRSSFLGVSKSTKVIGVEVDYDN